MPSKNIAPTPLVNALTIAVDAAAKLEADARAERERLEKALLLARGTGDVHEQAAAATKAAQTRSRSAGELSVRSGWHCTPRTNRSPGSSSPSTKIPRGESA